MGSCWPPPFVPHRGPRQSHYHLDSGSYRSLARIFSLCLELKDPNARECRRDSNLDGNGKDAIQIEDQQCLSSHNVKDSILDDKASGSMLVGNGDRIDQEHGGDKDNVVCEGIKSNADSKLGTNIVSVDRLKCGNNDFHEKQQTVIAKDEKAGNVDELADGLANDGSAHDDLSLCELINCESKATTLENDICCSVNEVEPQKVSTTVNSALGVCETVESSSCYQLPLASVEEQKIDQLKTELCRVGSSEKSAATGEKVETSNSMNEPSTIIENGEALGLEVNCSASKSLCQDPANSEDEEDTEEGQIPDDFLSSEEVVDKKVNENTQARASADRTTHRPHVEISRNGGLDDLSPSPASMDLSDEHRRSQKVYYGDIVSFMPTKNAKQASQHLTRNKKCLPTEMKEKYITPARMHVSHKEVGGKASNLPGNKISIVNKLSNVEGQPLSQNEKVKNKRGGSSEQKKAKKRIAKKRKRAQKDREQGVKRLKLQPVVKPKVVQICNFYLQGRCQQGDLCKFSHDAIPLTKSEPCRHLANDSCLKGDDCPYDHELFKYPCHNILLKGSCHRGDTCKFSHKVPADDSSLKVSTVRNLASPLTAEKLYLGKEKDAQQTTAIVSGPLKVSAPQSTHKQSVVNPLQSPKEHMRIPKGIQFLSFGNEQSVKKQKDTLLLGKHGGIKKSDQQNQEMHISECHKQEQSLNKKPLTMVTGTDQDSASNVFGLMSVEKKPSIAAKVPGAKILENEVSDASKILQEFLFGGIS